MRSFGALLYQTNRFLSHHFKCHKQHHNCHRMSDLTENLSIPKPLIAVCQMTATANKEDNFTICKSLIENAKFRGVQMVFLPECFDYVGKSWKQSVEMSEDLGGDLISRYRALAKKHMLWLSLGGFHQKNDSKTVKNTHVLIDSNGEIAGNYVKLHLFDVDLRETKLHESDYTYPGQVITPPIESPVGKIGLSICYDLRFPELAIALTKQGAQILTYPSAFMEPTGVAHWESLLRSRAIENQCYVVAAAQVGKHNDKRSSYGHTMVIDPWGTIIAECSKGTGMCLAEIDLDLLEKVRREMPVWNHRRSDLYGQVLSICKKPAMKIDDQPYYQFGPKQIYSNQVFLRTELSFAFVNIKPVVPGHVLVSPFSPVAHFKDLNQEQISDLWLTAQKVSTVVKNHFSGTALTFGIQDGKDAGQTIPHVHLHILPRRPGDFSNNDQIYEKIQANDENLGGTNLRSFEQMVKEASELRKYFPENFS
ncbi:NIT1 [Acanthosepion pharaonis]|uniref:Bis(5'-adenosyl)-triphosphatase n=1 Tax=Acanthosepion pharaonis TaxID=158019 RepID=A0A812C788_ACAPH|nr:NIT1 [Sepia pharaonis]